MYIAVCRVDVEGFHFWKDAPDHLAFLRSEHRHIFEIELQFMVNHADREIEIIETQQKVSRYLLDKYGSPCMFGGMSCEHIAEELSKRFGACRVSVREDGYGGAIYIEESES